MKTASTDASVLAAWNATLAPLSATARVEWALANLP
jgi:hypothetical protein